MELYDYTIKSGSGSTLGEARAASASAAIDIFRSWNPEYQFHELTAERGEAVDPFTDPATLTIYEACE